MFIWSFRPRMKPGRPRSVPPPSLLRWRRPLKARAGVVCRRRRTFGQGVSPSLPKLLDFYRHTVQSIAYYDYILYLCIYRDIFKTYASFFLSFSPSLSVSVSGCHPQRCRHHVMRELWFLFRVEFQSMYCGKSQEEPL